MIRAPRPRASHAQPRRGAFVLVETDGLETHAHRVSRGGEVTASAGAKSGQPLEDARTALTLLAGATGRLPRRAVLVSDEACAQGLELPRAMAERAPAEVHAALCWELEVEVAQRAAVRPLGALLLRMGHLHPEALDAILATQAERRATGGLADGVRIGQLAQALGHVDEAELASALALQRWMAGESEGLACAWTWPSSRRAPAPASSWVSALAMGGERLAAWRELFRERRTELVAVLAHETAPLGLLEDAALARRGALLHLSPSWASLLRWDSGSPLRVERSTSRGARWSAAELERWLAEQGAEPLWIAAAGPEAAELARELAARRADRVVLCAGSEGGEGDLEARPTLVPRAAALGALARIVRRVARSRLAVLGRGGPRDARRPRRVAAAALALSALGLAGYALERALERRAGRAAEEVQQLADELRALRSERSTVLEHNQRIESARLRSSEWEQREEETRRALAQEATRAGEEQRRLAEQRSFLTDVLAGLAECVGDQVRVTRIESSGPGELELDVHAVAPIAAQVFLARLQERLASHDLERISGRGEPGAGRYGVGHHLSVRFGREQRP